MGGGEVLEGGQVKGAGAGVEPEHGDEEEGGGDEGVDEELDGGAAAVGGAAEGRDENGHRDERELPEGVVEEEVERDEDADHGDLLEEEEDVEELGAGLDGGDVPGGEDAEGGEEAGEDDEPEGEAVDAEVVADGGVGDPGSVLFELESVSRVAGDVVEMGGEVECGEEGEEGDGEGGGGDELAAVWKEGEEDGADERDGEEEGEDGLVWVQGGVHGQRLQIMMARTAAAPSASQPA